MLTSFAGDLPIMSGLVAVCSMFFPRLVEVKWTSWANLSGTRILGASISVHWKPRRRAIGADTPDVHVIDAVRTVVEFTHAVRLVDRALFRTFVKWCELAHEKSTQDWEPNQGFTALVVTV